METEQTRGDGEPGEDGVERTVLAAECAGMRLDQALARALPDYSRNVLTRWLRDGHLLVDGETPQPRHKVAGGESVCLRIPREQAESWEPQAIDLDIVHEDADVLVVNKPAGLVVHPAAGNPDGTLVNALVHHAPELAELPRAGLVHRLDKDTTGLLVVARSRLAHTRLVADLQARIIRREYEAVVWGVPTGGGTIDEPIGRHPRDRKRMAVIRGGRPAVTHFTVEQRFAAHSHLRVRLETGRTHQIRVHMAHRRLPLVGDPVYGGRRAAPGRVHEEAAAAVAAFPRQALHAARLGLNHPRSGAPLEWRAPLPDDMHTLLAALAGSGRMDPAKEFDDDDV
ncbi:MAG: 23S rRNA pseudouridine(1911/1915/1917) synthase RluD [Pseudomonadota bacterium]